MFKQHSALNTRRELSYLWAALYVYWKIAEMSLPINDKNQQILIISRAFTLHHLITHTNLLSALYLEFSFTKQFFSPTFNFTFVFSNPLE